MTVCILGLDQLRASSRGNT